ncbi:flagellin biosynthesis protein FlgM [Escherichia coli]|nr:flagellin biosynthesis protein FlgM [Escherichia coli]
MENDPHIRNALRHMSWAQLSTKAREAEFNRDYGKAKILWIYAQHIARLSLNKTLAAAKVRFCEQKLDRSHGE